MDEELIIPESEAVFDVPIDEINNEIQAETTEYISIIEEGTQVVEVETIDEVKIEIDESIGWVGGDNTRHYSLYGRDENDQHPIKAITGLREELDEIEALKTVQSNQSGIASYYEWGDDDHADFGYFVSIIPHTSMVKICDGANIFGVTVDNAGFVGGQDASIPRDDLYALVSTSGIVTVRCESSVDEGDYVVSNAYGVASKTSSGCGYKVLAIERKHDVDYAVISLDIAADIIDALGKSVQSLDKELTDANINIAAAMAVANSAYDKATKTESSSQIISDKVDNALENIDDALSDINDMQEQVGSIVETVAQTKALAEAAVVSAESASLEAISKSNEALSKAGEIESLIEPISRWEYTDPVTGETNTGATYFAEYVKNELSTKVEMETVSKMDEENKLLIEQNAEQYVRMLSSVDKYSVGEYSQAYGLTIEQARNILKEGMIYIPTPHEDTSTHTEEYCDKTGNTLKRDFTHTFYYEWKDLGGGQTMWSEKVGQVWFGTEQPAGTAYDYWYDGTALYILSNGQWLEVATLAGNVNNRITSMVRQDVDAITAEVVNAYGGVAGFGAKIKDTEAKVNSYAYWPKDDNSWYNMATIDQSADKDGSNLVLAVVDKQGETILNGATIVLDQGGDDSFINISADRIMLDGETTFTVVDGGSTKINGASIATGTIDADKIKANTLSAISANLGTITAGNIGVGGWRISGDFFYSTKQSLYFFGAEDGTATYKIGDVTYAPKNLVMRTKLSNDSTLGLTADGKLYCTNAYMSGEICATSGRIGNEGEDGVLYVNTALNVGGAGGVQESTTYFRNGTIAFDTLISEMKMGAADNRFYIGRGGVVLANPELTTSIGDPIMYHGARLSSTSLIIEGSPASSLKGGTLTSLTGSDLSFRICGTMDGRPLDPTTAGGYSSLFGITARSGQISTSYTISTIGLKYGAYGDEGTQFFLQIEGPVRASGSFLMPNGTVYQTNLAVESDAPVTVSDISKKNSITELDEKYDKFFDLLKPSRFKLNAGTSGRYHTGFIAQDVKLALEEASLETNEFAGYVDYGNSCGLRYSEFVAINTYEIQKLKREMAVLYNKINLLESKGG